MIKTSLSIPKYLCRRDFFNVEGIDNSVISVHSENAFSPISTIELGIDIFFNDEQPLKAKPPILLTLEGMIILSKDLQALKTPFSREFTKGGMSTFSRDKQPLKAYLPILLTEEEIDILDSAEHLLKADSPIDSTKEGIFNSFNSEQLKNDQLPIEIKEEGNSMDLREMHPQNA